MDATTKELKQLWFTEALQSYMNRTGESLDSHEAAECKLFYEEYIKDAHCIISIDRPSCGDEPLVIRIVDNNSNQ